MSDHLPAAPVDAAHVPEVWLDQYSHGTLQEPQLGQLEEHLLICEECCERLSRIDDGWGLNG